MKYYVYYTIDQPVKGFIQCRRARPDGNRPLLDCLSTYREAYARLMKIGIPENQIIYRGF